MYITVYNLMLAKIPKDTGINLILFQETEKRMQRNEINLDQYMYNSI